MPGPAGYGSGDVEVVYDHQNHGGRGGRPGTSNPRPSPPNSHPNRTSNANTKPAPATAYTSNHGNAPYVDFENVFDPFERESDDVAEFFDKKDDDDDDDDVENPFLMFHDPRKVRFRRNAPTNDPLCLDEILTAPLSFDDTLFADFVGWSVESSRASNCWKSLGQTCRQSIESSYRSIVHCQVLFYACLYHDAWMDRIPLFLGRLELLFCGTSHY